MKDNAHWMDSSSFELLVSVIQQIPKLLIVIAYRKDEANDLFTPISAEPTTLQLQLNPFNGLFRIKKYWLNTIQRYISLKPIKSEF